MFRRDDEAKEGPETNQASDANLVSRLADAQVFLVSGSLVQCLTSSPDSIEKRVKKSVTVRALRCGQASLDAVRTLKSATTLSFTSSSVALSHSESSLLSRGRVRILLGPQDFVEQHLKSVLIAKTLTVVNDTRYRVSDDPRKQRSRLRVSMTGLEGRREERVINGALCRTSRLH